MAQGTTETHRGPPRDDPARTCGAMPSGIGAAELGTRSLGFWIGMRCPVRVYKSTNGGWMATRGVEWVPGFLRSAKPDCSASLSRLPCCCVIVNVVGGPSDAKRATGIDGNGNYPLGTCHPYLYSRENILPVNLPIPV